MVVFRPFTKDYQVDGISNCSEKSNDVRQKGAVDQGDYLFVSVTDEFVDVVKAAFTIIRRCIRKSYNGHQCCIGLFCVTLTMQKVYLLGYFHFYFRTCV